MTEPFSICKAPSSTENGHGTTGSRIRIRVLLVEGTRVRNTKIAFLKLKSPAVLSPESLVQQAQFGLAQFSRAQFVSAQISRAQFGSAQFVSTQISRAQFSPKAVKQKKKGPSLAQSASKKKSPVWPNLLLRQQSSQKYPLAASR